MLKIEKIYLDGGLIGRGRKVAVCDSEAPRLQWAISGSESDGKQKSFRVTVSDGSNNLFDSGVVESAEQSCTYAGEKLPHGKLLTVTVEAASESGEVAEPFSAQFVEGLLDEDELAAKWLSSEETAEHCVFRFKKELELREAPVAACLYAAGIGYQSLKINGSAVTDAKLEPAHSNYARLQYYTVHPEVGELLTAGKNVLTCEVADGWRSNFPNPAHAEKVEFAGAKQLWARLVVFYSDGSKEIFATDEGWLVKPSATVYASIFNGETYDARLENEEGYIAAKVVDAPGGVMRPMALEPIRHVRDYTPVEITTPKPGMYVVDFGQNLAGCVRLKLPKGLKSGQEITLRHSEELAEDGTLYTVTLRSAKQTDKYIAAGDGSDGEYWIPSFTYHGFRYCEVTGLDYIDRETVTAELWCTDLKSNSFFRCGSPILNAIHNAVVMTEMGNMHSILTDCPQRDERMGWMNDATVRFEETPYNFDIGLIFPKIVRDLMSEQDDGKIGCCAPFTWFGGKPADPVCSSYLVAGWQALMHTGNLDIVREAFDGFCAWEDVLLERSDDYIVNYSYYGDWAAPAYACEHPESARNAHTPGILMSTGYSYFNCVTIAKFAALLGKAEAEAKYSQLAEKVREAFLAKWFDEEASLVCGGAHGAQTFALWLDILPEESRQKAADKLARSLVESGYRFTTGNLCSRYICDVLARYGHIDVVYELLTKDTYPSFGFMLQNEATTIWERFELKKHGGMNSHNHPMYGAVGYFFYAYIMGVTPLEPGCTRVRIAPYMPSKLTSAQCVVETVKGDIAVRWSKRYGEAHLFIQIPFGVEAEVTFAGKSCVLGSGYHAISG